MPKILYLVTEDWFFVSHFLPMARVARAIGFDVVVATKLDAAAGRLVAEGFRLISANGKRGSLGAFAGLRDMIRAFRIVRAERPDVVHCIALRPIVLGGLAAKFAGAKALVLAPTGLGWLWMGQGLMARAARAIVRRTVASWLRGPATRYIFENHDDPAEFGLSANDPQVAIVGGAGVDPCAYPNVPEPPAPPLRAAIVARMIVTKGIAEAVEATRRARALGAAVELDLYGNPDPANRDSIPEAVLRAWSAEPGIRWHGHSDDVARVWCEHHVALFLSYREGLPRTLVEAAAAGRPIVTTDTPGCREIVRDGREGFLVPLHDIDAAARALTALAGDPALRAGMGAAAHARFGERFTEAAVQRAIDAVYRSLTDSGG